MRLFAYVVCGLWAQFERLDCFVQSRLAGDHGWRSTLILAVVSQFVSSIIAAFGLLLIGLAIYALSLYPVALVVLLAMGIVLVVFRVFVNAIHRLRDRREHEQTRNCGACNREVSIKTTVCPRCGAAILMEQGE